jgi:hypothetical protein
MEQNTGTNDPSFVKQPGIVSGTGAVPSVDARSAPADLPDLVRREVDRSVDNQLNRLKESLGAAAVALPDTLRRELDERIDSRLNTVTEAVKTATAPTKLTDPLRRQVDRRVDYHLKRVKEFTKLTVGWSTTILGVALAIVLFALAFFGYKTSGEAQDRVEKLQGQTKKDLDDLEAKAKTSLDALQKGAEERIAKLEQGVRKAVEDGIEKRLQDNNPVQYYQERIDKQYDRVLVSSYLTDLARRGSRFPRWVEGGEADAQRVIRILKARDTETALFSDALKVLTAARWPSSLNRDKILLDLVNDLKLPKAEVVGAPEKLILLVNTCSHRRVQGMERAVRALLDPKSEDNLVIAAIDYVREVGDTMSVEAIEVAANNPKLLDAAMPALARLNPSSPVLAKWMDSTVAQFKSGPVELSDCYTVFMVISNLVHTPSGRIPAARNADTAKRLDLADRLFELLVLGNVRFSYERQYDRDERSRLWLGIGPEASSFYGVADESFFLNGNSELLTRIVSQRVKVGSLDKLNACARVPLRSLPRQCLGCPGRQFLCGRRRCEGRRHVGRGRRWHEDCCQGRPRDRRPAPPI